MSVRYPLLPERLFWRHVGDCSHHHACLGMHFFCLVIWSVMSWARLGQLRQTEVEDLHVAVGPSMMFSGLTSR